MTGVILHHGTYSKFIVHYSAHNTTTTFVCKVYITQCSLPLKSKCFRQLSHRPLSGQKLQCPRILWNLLDETAIVTKRQLFSGWHTFCSWAIVVTHSLMTALTRVTAMPIVKLRLCRLCWNLKEWSTSACENRAMCVLPSHLSVWFIH
jgi:hypothetical protein